MRDRHVMSQMFFIMMTVTLCKLSVAALGKTCSELDITGLPVFSKTNFNMLQPDVDEYFKSLKGMVFKKDFENWHLNNHNFIRIS